MLHLRFSPSAWEDLPNANCALRPNAMRRRWTTTDCATSATERRMQTVPHSPDIHRFIVPPVIARDVSDRKLVRKGRSRSRNFSLINIHIFRWRCYPWMHFPTGCWRSRSLRTRKRLQILRRRQLQRKSRLPNLFLLQLGHRSRLRYLISQRRNAAKDVQRLL